MNMGSPTKRQKISPTVDARTDFISLSEDALVGSKFGYSSQADNLSQSFRTPEDADVGRGGSTQRASGRGSHDPRNSKDRPNSKHVLPGHEPWILVRTKFRRQFVHNTQTRESLWRIPKDVLPGVIEFERREKDQKEKGENARWAEEQLKQMRQQSKAEEVNNAAGHEGIGRRRRSESLQREDEQALIAELAVQAEHTEEQDAKETVEAVQNIHQRAQEAGLESDSEYEIVEVTDTEGEDEEDDAEVQPEMSIEQQTEGQELAQDEAGPVEFGEDDIAYQLAAMGEDYGLDPEEYGDDYDGEWEDGAEGLPLSDEDASNLFRDLLDDFKISPFTPWDKIIADESDASILNDHRYTVLPSMRARKEVFDVWVRDKAARLKQERAIMEKQDPKIPYLAFLQNKATPKLYWPEFKRKFRKEPELMDRKLGDKDRERLYRDHINRLKMPESSRKADLQTLLDGVPLRALNRRTSLDTLPQQVLSHLHFISLPPTIRDPIIVSHIGLLSDGLDIDDMTEEQQAAENKKREERRCREQAMAERKRKVQEERKRAEKDGSRARRDLREEELELQHAMSVDHRGLQTYLGEG